MGECGTGRDETKDGRSGIHMKGRGEVLHFEFEHCSALFGVSKFTVSFDTTWTTATRAVG
jgi:hypothetical protein